MNLNLHLTQLFTFTLLLSSSFHLNASTYTSAGSGNWFDANTWENQQIPSEDDDIIIKTGHLITLTATDYTHYGNISVESNGELLANVGDHLEGFVFCGLEFHLRGSFSTGTDQDFAITGDALFWAHAGSSIWVKDDFKLMGNANIVVEDICIRVNDDFEIHGTHTSLCGDGGVSIGEDTHTNNFTLMSGANINQVCVEVQVYRNDGVNTCVTLVSAGTGNTNPVAVDDQQSVFKNEVTEIDVLNMGTPDSDVNISDKLELIAVGTGFSNNQQTKEGGQVIILDKGTPLDPTDDVIAYTPPTNFLGFDGFNYIISDGQGGYAAAEVVLEVMEVLPVELSSFGVQQKACQVTVSWSTASELNNSHFNIERSEDGYYFEKIGVVAGSGTSKLTHVYDFVDPLPLEQNYYRLVQVDYNGEYTTSDVVHQSLECAGTKENIGIVTLFPNPVLSGNVDLRFKAQKTEMTALVMSDLYGTVVLRQEIEINPGMNNIDLDLIESLPIGTYVVQVGQQVTRLMVTR